MELKEEMDTSRVDSDINLSVTNWTSRQNIMKDIGDLNKMISSLTWWTWISHALSNANRYTCSITQSSPTFCNPMDCSPPGSSVCGIFQSRILEWVATFYSRGSSQPKDWTHISCIGRQILCHCTWETHTHICITICVIYGLDPLKCFEIWLMALHKFNF